MSAKQRIEQAMDTETDQPINEVEERIQVKKSATKKANSSSRSRSKSSPKERESEAAAELKATKKELETLKAQIRQREIEEQEIVDGQLLGMANQAHAVGVALIDRFLVKQHPWPSFEKLEDQHHALNISLVRFVKWLAPQMEINPGVAYGVSVGMFALMQNRREDKADQKKVVEVVQTPTTLDPPRDRVPDTKPIEVDLDTPETPFDAVKVNGTSKKTASPLSTGGGLVS